MNNKDCIMVLYFVTFFSLLLIELLYFQIADRFNIVDKPNERSSHTRIVLRGGGIIFTIALWVWGLTSVPSPIGEGNMLAMQLYPWLMAGVTLAAGVSFIDDVRSLPDSLRLVAQFVAMFLLFQQLGILRLDVWKFVIVGLIVFVGATNIYNFMDGINGITGGYSLSVLIPLFLLNRKYQFMDESFLVIIGISLLVFCLFNFRTKAKCFAGDVGSIGIAMILLFCIGKLILKTQDLTWLLLLLIYGVDGVLTIIHRIMLHENIGVAHRKHAYQLMANELKMPHVVVSTIYMVLQLVVSLIAIFIIPESMSAHWIYLGVTTGVMTVAYILFMAKYYHLHEAYLKGVESPTK